MPLNQNCTGSDLAAEKATVSCLLLCDQNACKQHKIFFFVVFKEWCQNVTYWCECVLQT